MNKTITELAALAMAAPYNEPVKKAYLREAKRFLRQLAEELELAPGDYDLRTNPAGIAVPGDATLHHERIYVTLGDCLGGMIGLARTCEGRKDYTGGSNNPIMEHSTNDWLVATCLRLLRA